MLGPQEQVDSKDCKVQPVLLEHLDYQATRGYLEVLDKWEV